MGFKRERERERGEEEEEVKKYGKKRGGETKEGFLNSSFWVIAVTSLQD